MRGRVQRLVSSLLMPGAWLLVMVAHWRWYRADTAQPSQPSPAQPSPAEDGDMQHTATADNLMLGTLRYLQRHRGSSALTSRSIPSPGRVLSSLSLCLHIQRLESRWFSVAVSPLSVSISMVAAYQRRHYTPGS